MQKNKEEKKKWNSMQKRWQVRWRGNQEGYDFLYQSTYQKKFFIAKKYMGNDMDAQDVLQDAYVQAFTKLNTLQDYQKFPNWFGMIVANTAKKCASEKENAVLLRLRRCK